MKTLSASYCVIIPAFMEQSKIGDVVRRAREYIPHVLVIDDGSADDTSSEAALAGAIVLKHDRNKGKGAALNTGFSYAREHGYRCVITMDADGQHDPADIPKFMEAHNRTGLAILVGNRMADAKNMPLVRWCANTVMSWYLSRVMKQFVPDTQCGFRLYRSDVIPFAATEALRYAAESETLLLAAARGITIGAVSLKPFYGDEKSKINPFTDTLRFVMMIRRFQRRKRRLAKSASGRF